MYNGKGFPWAKVTELKLPHEEKKPYQKKKKLADFCFYHPDANKQACCCLRTEVIRFMSACILHVGQVRMCQSPQK